MKKSSYKIFGFLFVMCSLMGSCKKWVEVGPPSDSLITPNVFANDGTAITAQFAAYARIKSIVATFDVYTALSSDELTNYSTNQFNIDLYRNATNAQNEGGLNGIWTVFYLIIYEENSILENIRISTGMSDRVKKLMEGEAKFTRAWCYFQLVNMFGDVPLVTSTDYKVNSTLPRTAANLVYEQIVSDLQSAQGLLSPSYLDASDNTGAIDRVRPTTWAADALLARVYLYMGKFDLAEQQASLVIANTSLFSLETDLTKVFKKSSMEAIWQLTPPIGGTYALNTFILKVPPGDNGPIGAASPQLLGAFEPNDTRRANWIDSYTQNGLTWNYSSKYRDDGTNTTLSEYVMALRLAELYLIRAEARAQQNEPNATDDLNAIRHRAGLPDYAGGTDLPSLLTAIAHERQVELFTEEDRWFDLKRTKKVDSVMQLVTSDKGGVWSSYQQWYPFSLSDLQFNPNLVQNQGY